MLLIEIKVLLKFRKSSTEHLRKRFHRFDKAFNKYNFMIKANVLDSSFNYHHLRILVKI